MNSQFYKITDICQSYKVETTFIYDLHAHGLIEIHYIESEEYLQEDQLPQIEKYYTWHHELELNIPAFDIVERLLLKINNLQAQLNQIQK